MSKIKVLADSVLGESLLPGFLDSWLAESHLFAVSAHGGEEGRKGGRKGEGRREGGKERDGEVKLFGFFSLSH